MAHKTSANPNDFILPDLGEGVHEAELISWKVEVGQQVSEHEIIAEMETDKALVEVPSPRDGVIDKLWGEPGQIMIVGEPLVSYVGDKAAAGDSAADVASDPSLENGAATAEREDDGTVVGNVSGGVAGVTAAQGKVLATPAVRRIARDLGIDINSVAGTGIAGRVTDKDVRAAGSGNAAPAPAARTSPPSTPAAAPAMPPPASMPTPAPAAPTAAPAGMTIPAGQDALRVPFRGVRRKIANRLRESVNQAVHFNVMDEVDVTALDAVRKQLAAASGEKVSFLPFVASAVCATLLMDQFRVLNSTVDDAANDGEGEIVHHRAVHLGIAADTEAGLMVPVIPDCDAFGVLEIGRHIGHLARGARDRSIPRERLAGSTFTISNVGSHAGRFATPVINYPEVGILAVGRARDGMVVKDGWFRVGKMLPLSLACDHRVVDGATAALALANIISLLGEPERLMAPARGRTG